MARRKLSLAKKIAFSAVVGAGALAAANGTLGVWWDHILPARDIGKQMTFQLSTYNERVRQETKQASYMRSQERMGGPIKVKNRWGHRNPDNYDVIPPEGQYRIACVGESTTLGEFVEIHETWPIQLQESLFKRFPNKDYLAMNMGHGGAVMKTTLLEYIKFHQKFNADLVILKVGMNDAEARVSLATSEANLTIELNETPRYGETLLLNHWGTKNFVQPFYRWWLPKSNEQLTEMMEKREKAIEEGKRRTIEGYGGETEAEEKARDTSAFEDYARTLVRLAKLNGSEVIIFQIPRNPYMKRKGSGRLEDYGSHANDLALQRISKEENVLYVPVDPLSIPEKEWKDHCHVLKGGQKIKTNLIEKAVLTHFLDEEGRPLDRNLKAFAKNPDHTLKTTVNNN